MGGVWLLWIAVIIQTTRGTSGLHEAAKGQRENNSEPTSVNTITRPLTASNQPALTGEEAERGKRELPYEGDYLDEEMQKRGPRRIRFSSWGGKRSKDESDIEQLKNFLSADKKSKFSSWAGKRNFEANMDKRAKFSAWGGKRNDDLEEIDEKRAKFNSWAGKRNEGSDYKKPRYPFWTGKRARFNSWAGKRSDDFGDGKRSSFSSWAGKRDETKDLEDMEDADRMGKRSPDYVGITGMNSNHKIQYYPSGMVQGPQNVMKLWQDYMSKKRARFSSWAGKRNGGFSGSEYLSPEDEEEKSDDLVKRKFSSWGGKRGGNESTAGEGMDGRDEYQGGIVKRSVYPWEPELVYQRKGLLEKWRGGHTIQTRSLPLQRVLMGGHRDRSWSSLLRPIRRGPDFYAWGGKRSA